jgi:hypothetical protein
MGSRIGRTSRHFVPSVYMYPTMEKAIALLSLNSLSVLGIGPGQFSNRPLSGTINTSTQNPFQAIVRHVKWLPWISAKRWVPRKPAYPLALSRGQPPSSKVVKTSTCSD